MADTEKDVTWKTSKSTAIACRVPNDLYSLIEEYGKSHFPDEKYQWEKTNTIIDLLRRGLESEGLSVSQGVSQSDIQAMIEQAVKQSVNRDVNQGISHDELQTLVEQTVKQLVSQDKLQSLVEMAVAHSTNLLVETHLDPIGFKLMVLSNRIKIVEEKLTAATEPETEITLTTEPLSRKQPTTDNTQSNDALPIEENSEALEGNLEGQSIEVTKSNINLAEKEVLSREEMLVFLKIKPRTLDGRLKDARESQGITDHNTPFEFVTRWGDRYIYEDAAKEGKRQPKQFRRIG